jgi:hypothetical protein
VLPGWQKGRISWIPFTPCPAQNACSGMSVIAYWLFFNGPSVVPMIDAVGHTALGVSMNQKLRQRSIQRKPATIGEILSQAQPLQVGSDVARQAVGSEI